MLKYQILSKQEVFEKYLNTKIVTDIWYFIYVRFLVIDLF